MTGDLLALLRRQHAGQRRLDLVDRVVDDVVVTDIDTEGLGQLARTGIGTGVEADDDGLGSLRQIDVGLADRTDRAVDDLDLDFFGGQLGQRLHQRFLRTLHVGLDDQRQRLDFALSHLLEHVLQLGGLLLGQLDVAELALTEQRDFTRLPLVGQHHGFVTGRRHIGQTQNFDRNRRTGFIDRLAVFVEHGAHTTENLTGQHDIAALQGTGLHQHGRHRHHGPCRDALR